MHSDHFFPKTTLRTSPKNAFRSIWSEDDSSDQSEECLPITLLRRWLFGPVWRIPSKHKSSGGIITEHELSFLIHLKFASQSPQLLVQPKGVCQWSKMVAVEWLGKAASSPRLFTRHQTCVKCWFFKLAGTDFYLSTFIRSGCFLIDWGKTPLFVLSPMAPP